MSGTIKIGDQNITITDNKSSDIGLKGTGVKGDRLL